MTRGSTAPFQWFTSSFDRDVVTGSLSAASSSPPTPKATPRALRGPLLKQEAGVPLLASHGAHVAQARGGHQQPDVRIAVPEWGQPCRAARPRRGPGSPRRPPRRSPRRGRGPAALRTDRRARRTPPGTPPRFRLRSRARRRRDARRSGSGAGRRPAGRPAGRTRGCCGRIPALARLAVEPDQHHGDQVALGHPRGHDPDHARVPSLAGQDQRRRSPTTPRSSAARARSAASSTSGLGVAALPVGAVELGRDRGRPVRVVGEHQLDAGVGAVEPAGGVDPRREAEGEVALVQALRLRPMPPPSGRAGRAAGPAGRREPAPHQRAVLAAQRDQVGDGGQRDQVEVGRGPLGPAGRRRACRRRRSRTGPGTGTPRRPDAAIGQSGSSSPGWWWSVTIDLEAGSRAASTSSGAGDPAVDRRRAARCRAAASRLDPVDRQAVAVREALRDVPVAVAPPAPQRADQDRGRGDAVHVVVAVDGDPPPGVDGGADPRHRPVHPVELERIVPLRRPPGTRAPPRPSGSPAARA